MNARLNDMGGVATSPKRGSMAEEPTCIEFATSVLPIGECYRSRLRHITN